LSGLITPKFTEDLNLALIFLLVHSILVLVYFRDHLCLLPLYFPMVIGGVALSAKGASLVPIPVDALEWLGFLVCFRAGWFWSRSLNQRQWLYNLKSFFISK
jgi:uncharacterized membrane protein YfcA